MSENKQIENYLGQQTPEVKTILIKISTLISQSIPDAEQIFSYGMPGFKLHRKPIIYYAAFTHHIGIYATPSAHLHFRDILKNYKQGKGSVQFPLKQPIPFELIKKMALFKAEEIESKIKK